MPQDTQLVQIVTDAFADAARRSGAWLKCGMGCNQCCTGVFAISALDIERLQHGLAELRQSDPPRAAAVLERAQAARARLEATFPGNPVTGILHEAAEDEEDPFEDFANEEVCPALDPATGTCDLYDARPMTCRVFGPPVQSEEGIGLCELCFNGAGEDAILASVLDTSWSPLEDELNREAEARAEHPGRSIVAFALK
ncbi:YkgJ family cysteine cluster protein [Silvibacterium sp.]|uniref:YkgJ family cysteine cluster protein n=1 Tax=Silvibacterium sp. TaxID=1964179 RepID=UPI0039E64046